MACRKQASWLCVKDIYVLRTLESDIPDFDHSNTRMDSKLEHESVTSGSEPLATNSTVKVQKRGGEISVILEVKFYMKS